MAILRFRNAVTHELPSRSIFDVFDDIVVISTSRQKLIKV